MEAIQQFGENLFGFQLLMGDRRWYIIRFYLALDDTSRIEIAVAALKYHPQVSDMLVVG